MGLTGQTLLGVTGSGKTYTMASIIEQVQKPTLIIAHNKTLAAQLCAEFRAFFPDSAVEYLSATMITTSRRPTSPPATPTSKRTPPSMTRSIDCATARGGFEGAQRCHHRRFRLLHLRHG